MIKLLALDMDGTLLNEAKEIPQAHITAIHQAIEKGVKLVLCTGRPLFGVLPYYKKLELDLQNEYIIVNNGCSTHQTSDWSLVDWKELSPADIEYLYDLAEKSDVQLTLFDESHYFVLGGKPNQVIEYEAMPLGTTKATALSRLAEILKIDSSEIMAMGDANNDIEMLQFAGLGIAMGNASDYVKSLADAVTSSNEEDGVARAIEKYIL